MITKLLKFLTGLILAYLGIILLLSNIYIGDHSILARTTENVWKPGTHRSYSLLRFRDIEEFENIDILFAGSSHCFRAFDPRIFSEKNLETFNMGSNSQSPLNTYYLLKRYIDRLNPKLLVYEIYFEVLLSTDGLESYYDLMGNTGYSFEMLEMALATNNPNAFNAMTGTYLRRIWEPLSSVEQVQYKEKYVYGGYCERTDSSEAPDFTDFGKIKLADIQFEYLEKMIRFLRERNVGVLFVTHPLPDELVAEVHNYDDISRQIDNFAKKLAVEYIDFNEILDLETDEHFKDSNHLNSAGVQIFNAALIDTLWDMKLSYGLDASKTKHRHSD